MHNAPTRILLNVAHAIDHMFLLIFATAVTTIALEFGLARWEDLMPYGAAAFFFFGVGSLPSGKLGDHWGRRSMMLLFFFRRERLRRQHRHRARRGGTGFLVKSFGWRLAFVLPGLLSIACGIAFLLGSHPESTPPARRKATQVELPTALLARVFLVMTLAAISGGLLFNFSTNGNYELLHERLAGVTRDPAVLGLLLAGVYAVASLAQLVVGRLIDRFSLKRLYLTVLALQVPFLALAANAQSWALYVLQALFMVAIFGAIPFTDAMIVRYVDDRMRSRVAGMRLAVSFGASALAVWLLGPLVKQSGFTTLLWIMAGVATITFLVVTRLPEEPGATRT